MFSANASGENFIDLRTYYVAAGSSYSSQNDLVLGISSDDTDQGGVGTFRVASTFTLPYSATQNFYIYLLSGGGTYNGLNINVIGYQV